MWTNKENRGPPYYGKLFWPGPAGGRFNATAIGRALSAWSVTTFACERPHLVEKKKNSLQTFRNKVWPTATAVASPPSHHVLGALARPGETTTATLVPLPAGRAAEEAQAADRMAVGGGSQVAVAPSPDLATRYCRINEYNCWKTNLKKSYQ